MSRPVSDAGPRRGRHQPANFRWSGPGADLAPVVPVFPDVLHIDLPFQSPV